MNELLRDLRYGLRQIGRNPGFAIVAVLCLALGIGANSATFSFAEGLLLRTPRVTEPERMIRLFVELSDGTPFVAFSYPDYADLRAATGDVLSGLAAAAPRPFHVSTEGRNERLWGAIVSGDYFSVLGVAIPHGRGFLPEEDRSPGSHPVVVLGHGLWQRRFAGDPDLLGRSVTLNGRPFTVIGIAPEGFVGPDVGFRAELWVPLAMHETVIPGNPDRLEVRGNHWLTFVIGRLRPGIAFGQAEAKIESVMARLAQDYPDSNEGKAVDVYPEEGASLHPMARGAAVGFFGLMFAVVGLVLVLACVNVAGLLLARATGRRREIAVRLALGAKRGRLIRQLLTESLLIAVLAGGVGLLLGASLLPLVQSARPPVDLPLDLSAGLDGGMLLFALLISLITVLLFGLTPALQATRIELTPALQEGTTVLGRSSSRLRRLLVVVQTALSTLLLVVAGMVLTSLIQSQDADVGFEPERQLLVPLDLDLQGYEEHDGAAFFEMLESRVLALPGVEAAGYADFLPLSLLTQRTSAVPLGYQLPDGDDSVSIDFSRVGPGYFAAMGIAIEDGREFERTDRPEGRPVAIVNRTAARRYWPESNPLGQQIRAFDTVHEVVGVAADGKYFRLGEPSKAFLYVSIDQHYRGSRTLHLRTAGDPRSLTAAVREEISSLDPTLPLTDIKPMQQQLDFVLLPMRIASVVVTAFALLALLLASVGLYGLIAYQVEVGGHDLGVRMALGAEPWDILRVVLRRGVLLVLVGLGLGLAAGYAFSRLATGFLHGVQGTEPGLYLGAGCALLVATVLASVLPARRALGIDPVDVLRME